MYHLFAPENSAAINEHPLPYKFPFISKLKQWNELVYTLYDLHGREPIHTSTKRMSSEHLSWPFPSWQPPGHSKRTDWRAGGERVQSKSGGDGGVDFFCRLIFNIATMREWGSILLKEVREVALYPILCPVLTKNKMPLRYTSTRMEFYSAVKENAIMSFSGQ